MKKFIFISLLLFLLLGGVMAFAGNNSFADVHGLIGLELTVEGTEINQKSYYEEECGKYIKYFQSLVICKIYKKTADIVKEKTCYKINLNDGNSKFSYSKPKADYKLINRLKVSNFRPYGEIVLVGSQHRYRFKFYPTEKKIFFQLEVNF